MINLKNITIYQVTIFYETSKDAPALNWLNKEQTMGKNTPYLFS